MKIATVRHGESLGAQQKIHQSANTPLSSLGIEQAKRVAKSLTQTSFSCIWSSDSLRAKQTADIIAQALHMKPSYLEDLREWRRPSELVGRPYEDEEVKRIKLLAREHYGDPDWHYSDEENFSEIVARAKRLLARLSSDESDKILVTHARFLSVLFWVIATSQLTAEDYLKKQNELYISLGSYRILSHDHGKWSIVE